MPTLIALIPRARLGAALAAGWDDAFADAEIRVPAGRALVARAAAPEQTHSEITATFAELYRRVDAARLTGS